MGNPRNSQVFDAMFEAKSHSVAVAMPANLLRMQKTKLGYQITFGISHEWGDKLMAEKAFGVVFMAERDEFFATQKKLEEAE